MGRTLLYPFAGAGIGFLAALVIVQVMTGGSPARGDAFITFCAGVFLAGAGAVSGAILGAVELFTRRLQTRQQPPQPDPQSDP